MLNETINFLQSRTPVSMHVYIAYLANKYVISVLILLAAVVAAKLILFIFERYLKTLAKKTETELDDLLFERTEKPLFWLVLIYGLKLALENLAINGWVDSAVKSMMAVVFVYIIMSVTGLIIEVWGNSLAKKTESKLDDVLIPLFQKIIKVIFVLVAILWLLKIWGVDITPYLAGAGIGGLVLGFALQDSLKNVFGGITLMLDENFEVGDKVKLESGDVGEVLDIGLRSTKIRTYDNEVIYVPNGYLANSRILNYTRPTVKIRNNVEFGVEYGSDIQNVKDVVTKVITETEGILEDPAPAVQFLEMGASELKFKAHFWVGHWGDGFAKKLELTEKIYNALNKAGIGIPFPQMDVHIKKE